MEGKKVPKINCISWGDWYEFGMFNGCGRLAPPWNPQVKTKSSSLGEDIENMVSEIST
jgi:hypothetical protein